MMKRRRVAGTLVFGLDDTRAVENAIGKSSDIAGDGLAVGRRHQIKRPPGAESPSFDDIGKLPDAALRILFGEALDLGFDGLRGLLVDEIPDVPGDFPKDQPSADRKG